MWASYWQLFEDGEVLIFRMHCRHITERHTIDQIHQEPPRRRFDAGSRLFSPETNRRLVVRGSLNTGDSTVMDSNQPGPCVEVQLCGPDRFWKVFSSQLFHIPMMTRRFLHWPAEKHNQWRLITFLRTKYLFNPKAVIVKTPDKHKTLSWLRPSAGPDRFLTVK